MSKFLLSPPSDQRGITETELASLTLFPLHNSNESSHETSVTSDEALPSSPTISVTKVTMWNVSRKRSRALLILGGGSCLSILVASLILFTALRNNRQQTQAGIPAASILGSRVIPLAASSYHVNPTDHIALLSHQSSRPPNVLTSAGNAPYPTSAWYQNLLLLPDEAAAPSTLEHAYAIPYLLDAAGPVPGIRLHSVFLQGDEKNIYANYATAYSVTLGSSTSSDINARYQVKATTPLGVTLEWSSNDNDDASMQTPLVQGMPYATMIYSGTVIPMIATEIAITSIRVDQNNAMQLECGSTAPSYSVQNDLEIYLAASDATWLIFPSEPVTVQCSSEMRLQFTTSPQSSEFILRLALSQDNSSSFNDRLRRHSNWYPGSQTHVSTRRLSGNSVEVNFDWDAQRMRSSNAFEEATTADDLLMMTLPHHQQYSSLQQSSTSTPCAPSLFGPACFQSGSRWTLTETIPHVDWRAPRSPTSDTLSVLGEALKTDLQYQVFELFRRGGGDTYFSGKQLAKLGRICLVADEWLELCSDSASACGEGPTTGQLNAAVQELKQSVEIWLNGTGLTPFVYDSSWGGVISCGCMYDGGVGCTNRYPDCPALTDPLLNFGNAYYNDQHFHYGYFIYAAAIVSHFDPSWGRLFYDKILLLIKSIANDDQTDPYFTTFRHKDWYLGSSWASGMNQPPFNRGRNQESSSEAVAAYEAVALYGRALAEAWLAVNDQEKAQFAEGIQTTGLALLTTEIRSTQRYWHIHPGQTIRIYPDQYKQNVVGIVWQLMLVFSTWFGSNVEYIYGIQLLPLTPIAESRDERTWLETIYPIYANACANIVCSASGWKVLQIATLASVGYQQQAIQEALSLPATAFNDAAGGGQSLSNTLWYIATRPRIDNPVSFDNITSGDDSTLNYCSAPSTCTDAVLDSMADGFSCRSRIIWLVGQGSSVTEACAQVAGVEFPNECGPCNPSEAPTPVTPVAPTPTTPVTNDSDELAYCDTSTCTDAVLDTMADGFSCRSRITWLVGQGSSVTEACVQVAGVEFPNECGPCDPSVAPTPTTPVAPTPTTPVAPTPTTPVTNSTSCPRCSAEVCDGDMNSCPTDQSAPYLCTLGPNVRGCNANLWPIDQHCFECCDLRLCGEPVFNPQPTDPTPAPVPVPSPPSHTNDSEELAYCDTPTTCTDAVLSTTIHVNDTGTFSCRSRMEWLMEQGQSRTSACTQVAVTEFPAECGECNPSSQNNSTVSSPLLDVGCCSRDYKTCVSSCGNTEVTCGACGYVWLPDGARNDCEATGQRCNARGLNCCPGLQCRGFLLFRRCRATS